MISRSPQCPDLPERVRRLLGRVCHESTMARIVEPVTADWQHEAGTAVTRNWRRSTVHVRWACALLGALALDWATRPTADAELRSGMAVLKTTAVAWTAITTTQVLAWVGRFGWEWQLLYVFPSIQTGSLPAAVFFGALSGDRRLASAGRTVLMSVIAACLMAFRLVSVIPAKNQAFRVATWRAGGGVGTPAPGPNEHTFARLRTEETRLRVFGDHRTADALAVARHTRLMLPVICLTLGWLGGALASAGWWRSRAKFVVGGTTTLTIAWVTMLVGRDLVRSSAVVPWLGAWLPVLFSATAAFAVHFATRLRRA